MFNKIEDYSELCLNQKTCSGDSILAQYWKGFTCYYNDDLQQAIYHLTPLAEDRYTVKDAHIKYLCNQILTEAHAFVGGAFEYDNSDLDKDLVVQAHCHADAQGVKHHSLIVDIPAFMSPVLSIQWTASNGGTIIGSASSDLIQTSGVGTYTVTVTTRNCTYTTEYIYGRVDLDCEEDVENTCDYPCPVVQGIQRDYTNNCYTIEIFSDSSLLANFVFRYYGILNGGNDYHLVETIVTPIFLVNGINYIEHCGISQSSQSYFWYDLITYELVPIGCSHCSYEEDYLAIWLRPDGENVNELEVLSTIDNNSVSNPIISKAYPNPFSNGLQIEMNNVQNENIRIEVANTIGQSILNKNWTLTSTHNRIPLNELDNVAPGVYTIKIKSDAGESYKKVIKIE